MWQTKARRQIIRYRATDTLERNTNTTAWIHNHQNRAGVYGIYVLLTERMKLIIFPIKMYTYYIGAHDVNIWEQLSIYSPC